MSPSPTPSSPNDNASSWAEREAYWRRKLGRLKLGVEPLAEQLDRYWRVTWALTIVPAAMAAMFLALFAAFRAVGVGLAIVGLILVPVVAVAWVDYFRLKNRAARYESERREFESRHASR
jgi:hypothetical protein